MIIATAAGSALAFVKAMRASLSTTYRDRQTCPGQPADA
jgi:hypothetical protein